MPSNTVLYQSPSIERVLGYTVEEVTGRPFEQLLHPDEQGRLLRRLTDGAGGAGRSEVIDCLLAHKDGSLRHFEILHADLLSDTRGRRDRAERPRRLASARRSRSSSPTRPSTILSPTSPTGHCSTSASATRSRGPCATASGWLCCSSTSTTSRPSTTASATPPATGSCSRWRSACPRASGPPTPPPASAATSSRSCSRTCTTRRWRSRPPSASLTRSPARSSSTTPT